jgi:glycosyltransferase involved in cell wall biosynthesis
VHALAQLPNEVTLALSEQLPEIARLATAYGIDDRLGFGPTDGAGVAPPVASTMAELVHALSRPGDGPSELRFRDEGFTAHRVAVLTNLPAPYRIPLLEKISTRLGAAGARFRVFFMGARAKGRPWIGAGEQLPFEHEWLSSLELPLGVRRPLLPLNLERRLGAFEPTIVLAAGFSPFVSARAARWARKHRAAYGIWSGEIAGRKASASALRRTQRRRLARKCHFAIAYGFLAGEYLRELRPDLPFVYGRNTSAAHGTRREPPDATSTVRLLAVADMAKPGKGIDLLIDALKRVPELECSLLVVGPGAGASGLEDRARTDPRIEFAGALSQAEVRERYSRSDVFLFPSTAEADVFGLALVEAMGSGLAPLVSSGPGVAADLAVDRWNCRLIGERTPEAWAQALREVVFDRALRLELARNAELTIRSRWTMDHACDAMVAGLRLALPATRTEAAT